MSTKKTILITGCSSGFGDLTARTLARTGHEVYASMRGVEGKNAGAAKRLRQWAAKNDRSVDVVELDVTSDASVAAAAHTVLEKSGRIDAVVNNAGVVAMGICESHSPEDFHRIFDVNVHGVLRVTNAFLPAMREQKDGLVVTISSIMGRIVLPFAGAYTASKWAVEGLMETYRYELAPLGIDTVVIEPGAFPTEIGNNGMPVSKPELAAEYGPVGDALNAWFAGFEDMFSGDNPPDPQEVADAVCAAVDAPRGSRTFRVVVDRLMTAAPTAVNAAYEPAEKAILNALHLGALAELKR